MAIAVDRRPDTVEGDAVGIQRRRGGFYRAADDTPWITHPTEHRKQGWPGKHADLVAICTERGIELPAKVTIAQMQELLGPCPKRVPYGSPSGAGKQIENTYNLVKWGERRFALGIGLDRLNPIPVRVDDHTYPSAADACIALAGMDVDSDEYQTLADAIVAVTKDAAKISLAADQGTHTHSLSEDSDEGRNWEQRAEAGELLGIPVAAQRLLVAAWKAMVEREGLEILVVEFACVDDIWHLAGTGDRIARLTRDLRFVMLSGEIVVIPAGTIVVLDIKSGQLRTIGAGAVMYWQGYAIQVRSYAQSLPYNTETETRGEWPFEISLTHGLIAHLDVAAAIASKPVDDICHLVYVDLEQGKAAGDLCVAAKAWDSLNRSRSTTFSIAQLRDDEPAAAPSQPTDEAADTSSVETATTQPDTDTGCGVEPPAGQDSDPTADTGPAAPDTTPTPVVSAATPDRRTALLARYQALDVDDRRRFMATNVDMADLDAIQAALDAIDTTAHTTAPDVRRALITREVRAAIDAATPEWSGPVFAGDEGDLIADAVRDDMRTQIETLSPGQRAVLDQIAGEAAATVGRISLANLQSRRRWEIARALVTLVRFQWHDEAVRGALATVTNDDACHDPAVGFGVLIGSLPLDQAIAFADLATAIANDDVAVDFTDGRWRWTPAAA